MGEECRVRERSYLGADGIGSFRFIYHLGDRRTTAADSANSSLALATNGSGSNSNTTYNFVLPTARFKVVTAIEDLC